MENEKMRKVSAEKVASDRRTLDKLYTALETAPSEAAETLAAEELVLFAFNPDYEPR